MEIRALTVGEVLDEAFVLFRRAFLRLLAFPLIAFIPTALAEVLVIEAIGNIVGSALKGGLVGIEMGSLGAAAAGAGGVLLVQLIIGPPVTVALIQAVADSYLGRRWTIASLSRVALRMSLRAIGTELVLVLLFLFAVGVPLGISGSVALALYRSGGVSGAAQILLVVVAGLVAAMPIAAVGIYLYLRYGLSFVALVIEDLSVTGSLRRSANLMKGRYWSAFGLLLVLLVVGLLLGFLASAFVPSPSFETFDPDRLRQILPQLVRSQTLSTLLGEAMGMFTRTYTAIAWTLFYFSARCEREGFDLAFLAEKFGAREVGT